MSILKETFAVTENSRNVHTLETYYKNADWTREIFLCSDPHWDNPKCDRDLLKRHLDEAVKRKAKIIFNGDLFCLMQGWGDPRSNKSDIRPEHNNAKYIDSVIETAVEWFKPYAEHIAVVGYGNHETSVMKRRETDVIRRFVDLMNFVHRPQQAIRAGGYGGWIRFVFQREKSNDTRTIKLKYYHGSGKDPEVTKGMIGNHRRQASIHGADIIWTGHIHNMVQATYVSENLNKHGVIELRETEHIITGTYKEEYADGHHGFHIERGGSPKPLGGMFLKFYHSDKDVKFEITRAK